MDMNNLAQKLALFCTLACALSVAALTASAMTADVTGKWTSTFQTQIGEQHYTYDFAVDGEKLAGTAKNDMGETAITDGVVKGDDISFVETINFSGQEIKITYTGRVSGDEIKFTRKVADFATEEIVAKRLK
jgi:opacity protein-like surface antigen